MDKLLLFFVAAVGLTHILVDSKIGEPIRDLATKYLPEKISYLFSCYQCSGVWLSAFLGILTYGFDWPKVILCAFAGSFLANTCAIYLNYLEAKTFIAVDGKDV